MIARNAFTILEIEPTDNFKAVKKAYFRQAKAHHPDKHGDDKEATAKFQEISAAWGAVDDELKLAAYYHRYQAGELLDDDALSFDTNSPDDFPIPEDEIRGDELRKYKSNEYVEIFVPVPYDAARESEDNEQAIVTQDKEEIVLLHRLTESSRDNFAESINPEYYARIITNMSSKYMLQIGVTEEEAMAIANLHSIWTGFLVVQIKISINSLSDSRQSEKDRFGPHVLNAKEGDYFWMEKHTMVHAANIISISGLNRDQYYNTRRCDSSLLTGYWLEGYRYGRPRLNAAQQQHLSLCEAAEKEIKRLEGPFCLNSKEKLAAIRAAIDSSDDDKIREALAIRRLPSIRSIFGQNNPPSRSQVNTANIKVESSAIVKRKN